MLVNPKPNLCTTGYESAQLPKVHADIDSAIKAIREHARFFDFAAPAQAVDPIVQNARVIGLGEGSHGTAEFFRLQTEVAKYLIREKEVRLVLVELPPGLAEAMNLVLALQLPDGAVATLVEDTIRRLPYETWNSQEFEGLLLFIRDWNRQYPQDAVVFRGIDITSYNACGALEQMAHIADAARNKARQLSERLGALVEQFNQPSGIQAKDSRSDLAERFRGLWQEASTCNESFKGDRPAYLLLRSLAQTSYYQWCMAKDGQASQSVRDELMASNVIEEVERLSNGKRAVVLAHNGHVSFDESSTGCFSEGMGREIRMRFGCDGYRVLIATGGGGSVTSRELTMRRIIENGEVINAIGLSSERKIYLSDAPAEGSFEQVLSQAVDKPVCLSVEAMINDQRLAPLVTEPIAFRKMGCSLLLNEFRPVRLAGSCDGIVYFPKTTGSKIY